MTIGSTPGIAELVTEFGGTGALTDYLRGGSYVPNVYPNDAVATSLPISLLSFASTTVDGAIMTSGNSVTPSQQGYSDGTHSAAIGSLTLSYAGSVVRAFKSNSSPASWEVWIAGSHAQSVFTSAYAYGSFLAGSNPRVEFHNSASAATYGETGGATYWTWSLGDANDRFPLSGTMDVWFV